MVNLLTFSNSRKILQMVYRSGMSLAYMSRPRKYCAIVLFEIVCLKHYTISMELQEMLVILLNIISFTDYRDGSLVRS